jgi:hypothetical protein
MSSIPQLNPQNQLNGLSLLKQLINLIVVMTRTSLNSYHLGVSSNFESSDRSYMLFQHLFLCLFANEVQVVPFNPIVLGFIGD